MSFKILIVDDDEDFRAELQDSLDGYVVIEACCGEAALNILKKANDINLVILDVMMPGLSGTEVLREMKDTDPGLGIIILTAFGSKDVAVEALKGRADDYIEKPVDVRKLKESIDKVLQAKKDQDSPCVNNIKGKVDKVKYFIERNCYKKTGLKEAAQSVYLSPKYLSRVFKDTVGVSFCDYRLGIKIKRAKELLNKSGYNVNQTSEKLGYENAVSFIRQFKKRTGYTPTEYRKKHTKKRK